MECAALWQEARLAGENVIVLGAVLGVGLLDLGAEAVGVQLVEDRGHHDGAVVGGLGQVITLEDGRQLGGRHGCRLGASSVDSAEEVLYQRPDGLCCQGWDWYAGQARGGPRPEPAESSPYGIIIEDGIQLLFCGRGQWGEEGRGRGPSKDLAEVLGELRRRWHHRGGLSQATMPSAPKVGGVGVTEALEA